jgi:hypothetical protein
MLCNPRWSGRHSLVKTVHQPQDRVRADSRMELEMLDCRTAEHVLSKMRTSRGLICVFDLNPISTLYPMP